MAESLDAAACGDFSKLLDALKQVRGEPTLDVFDRYAPSSREVEMATQVCAGDCVIALTSVEVRRQLCLEALLNDLYSIAIVLGQQITEDKEFLDYLRLFVPDKVTVVSSASPMVLETFEGICLIEPDLMMSCLASGALDRYEIGTLVFMDFQHYLDPGHIYRDIVGLYVNGQAKKEPKYTRLLAFTEELQVNSFEDLEATLMTLRTPLGLKCYLGTPARPYAKNIQVPIRLVDTDWVSNVGTIVSTSDDPDVQEVATVLRERGILAARQQADKASLNKSSRGLRKFLLHSRRLLSKLKANVILENIRGRTLALTTTTEFQQDIRSWLQKAYAPVIERPHEADDGPQAVLVATMADIPTVKRCRWDSLVMCDLPFGVSCDELLLRAGRAVALATEPEQTKWQEVQAIHDNLEQLLARVNEV